MNAQRPLPLWRDITPHAFAFDGLRWHLRAYCHLETRFKDFILSRFLDLGPEITPEAHTSDDTQWSTFFNVLLIPNPKLSQSQQETVALDYDMKNWAVCIPVRRALLYYFNKRLRLDIADRVDDPKETPVVVANRAAFEEALRLANV
jgi:predicted DNA-binding transcriptional regulator YafY